MGTDEGLRYRNKPGPPWSAYDKGLGSFASEHLASGHETQEYENDGDRNEQEKEELGDIRGSSSHSGKAQHGWQ